MTGGAEGLPRNIWFLWFQGLDSAPYVVRKCHESWNSRNPAWRVVTLDESILANFTTVDYSGGNLAKISMQHRADLLRLDLLRRYGGVWVDATCFCVQPLDDWLLSNMGSGFFGFHQPGPDRMISNWFLAAEPGNALVSKMFDRMLSYWADSPLRWDERRMIARALTKALGISRYTRALWFSKLLRDWISVGPYYAFHYTFENLVNSDRECASIWSNTPKISADGPHRLWRAGLLSPASDALRWEIDRRDVPVYKTTWKLDCEAIPSDSVLSYLLEMTHT